MSEKIPRFFNMTKTQLHVKSSKILNLVGLPKELPEINFLEISGRETNGQIPVPMNFRSFKGLPKIMPKLEVIWIYDSNIQNFESLTPNMPCLKNFSFLNCHIHNFKGIPKKPVRFGFSECKIDSFEGLHVNNLEMFDDPQGNVGVEGIVGEGQPRHVRHRQG